MRLWFMVPLAAVLMAGTTENGCEPTPSSDAIQRQQQEKILQEGTSAVGMPSIHNFREKKLLKDILELRDQAGYTTYTYLWSEVTGKAIFFCNSIGYPLPYATQFTNPTEPYAYDRSVTTINQADPNGLFSPQSAEATWVMCADPAGGKAKPVYVEPKTITTPFQLPASVVTP